MTLLSPLALLFALVAAVPLILHLHQNRKRTVMLFSTNRFFTESVVRTQRRLKLRRWLLLILRMAACILLALALSQPILAWSGLSTPKGNRDLVILLDDSLSTTAATSSPAMTVFGLGRDQALRALDQLVTGDRAAVITTTGRILAGASADNSSPTADLLMLRDQLAKLQPTQSAGDNPAALRIAASLFTADQNLDGRARATLILTDNQRTDWRSGQWPALPLGCTTQIIALDQPAPGSTPASTPGITADNVTADHLSLATPGNTAILGQPNSLTVRIVNHAPARRKAQLHLLINDQLVADQPLELPGQSAALHTFPVNFSSPGEQRIKLELLGLHDALPDDDILYAIVHVQSQLPVLLVRNPADAGRRSGAFYLQAALEAAGESDPASGPATAGVKVHTISPDALSSASLAATRAVFLCDVDRLSPDAAAALRSFVAHGGGLAIFPGSHIDADWYNTQLADLLPATLGPPLSITDRPLPIVSADISHPLLSRFSDELRAAISGITVTQARSLTPHDAWLIAQLDGDHPFILQRSYLPKPGQSDSAAPGSGGNVVLLACDPEPQSTNLPIRRLFIPFVNRLASYLASTSANSLSPLAYTVGSPFALPADAVSFDVDHPPSAVSTDNLVVPAHVIANGAAPQLSLCLAAPGFYSLGSVTLAANTPRSESNPATLTNLDSQTTADWHVLGVTHINGSGSGSSGSDRTTDLAPLLSASRSGRGYWHPLLYLVLIVVLVEPLIANYAKRPVKSAQSQTAPGQRGSAAPGSTTADREAA